jgi:hypothetical protein
MNIAAGGKSCSLAIQGGKILPVKGTNPMKWLFPSIVASAMLSFAAIPQIPAGTVISVKTIDRIESDDSREGQMFRASLAEPIVVNGATVAPRGSDAQLKVVEVKDAGRVKGRAELTVTLVSVTADGQTVNLLTENTTSQSKGKGKGTATKTGIGAGVGAALGAIFGGGKGAAIGAGAGAATGAGVAMVMQGPRVVIPSETQLSFAVR